MPDSNNPGSVSTSSTTTDPSSAQRAASGTQPSPSGPSGPGGDHAAADRRSELSGYKVHWGRYRRTLIFAAWLFGRVILWEIVLRRVVGDSLVARGRSRRLRKWAREFRGMAARMGGVMIKLGQFISSRVDVLPPEVTEELAHLQDEVPTVDFSVMHQTVEEELGPLDVHFAWFDHHPVAAASLGQAHRARLPNGDRVVVKIQRPGIRSLVFTDLKALSVVAGWAMKFRFIARRADVPALLDEFSAVLWEELDYCQEADHVVRFGAMFENNPGIYIPRLHPDLSTERVLTLEDVTAIKITDYAAIEAAEIDRPDVARRLVNTYLYMVFIERFFHADPHPGNLFVYPIPPDVTNASGHDDNGQQLHGRPFYLVFVDFGMVGHLTPEIASGLRETLIALTTRDAHRLVQSYQRLGVLLPGADLDRIEAASRAAFDRVWGLSMSELGHMQFSEMSSVAREFSDLLFSLPFQVPQDFLYLTRAVGILTGIATGLDPAYDPWHEIQPFVRQLMAQDGRSRDPRAAFAGDPRAALRALLAGENLDVLLDTGIDLARRAIQLPALADDVLRRVDRGELTIRVAPTPDLEHQLHRIETANQRIVTAIVFAAFMIGTVLLYTAGFNVLSVIGLVLTVISFSRVLLLGNSRRN